MRDLLELQLNWDPAQVVHVVRACNGCGDCRAQAAAVRMCPIFRILPSEEASPRAKANLIRGVLTGELPLSSLTSDEFKRVADLCVNCQMCAVECPARVDIPKLMLEGKGAYVAANGLGLHDRIMSRLDLASALACRVSPLANWALKNRLMRWLMEKTLGIAQGRKLPRVASRTFLRRAARRKLTRPARRSGRRAAYFVDLYANYHDPQLAEATVAVLEHNGVSVYVPPEQVQAGTAAISCGALDIARQLARQNVAVLAEAVRQGYQIVATEPAAALSLIREYPNLLDDVDVRLVADNTSEVCTYLWRMHTQGKLQLDLHPIYATLGYHAALPVEGPRRGLARRAPAAADPRVERRALRGRVLGNGRDLRPPTGKLPRQLAGRPGPDRAAPRSEHRGRHDGVQHLQDADGTGHSQADHPPHQALGPLLRHHARAGNAADGARRGAGRQLGIPPG